ncbi:hypothetical protein GWK47_036078 [Chionoecetes opilio]|uniref:Uncharacterized protein n=1 Tax=Chionoecetes opilio TaxID=41210 RepID=A0A8J4YMQ3_CHIOP|nr:hypothetical protein GWK47_036078 [Chionoecetes opilio]
MKLLCRSSLWTTKNPGGSRGISGAWGVCPQHSKTKFEVTGQNGSFRKQQRFSTIPLYQAHNKKTTCGGREGGMGLTEKTVAFRGGWLRGPGSALLASSGTKPKPQKMTRTSRRSIYPKTIQKQNVDLSRSRGWKPLQRVPPELLGLGPGMSKRHLFSTSPQ